jgi:site-specific DNA-methyltransferase (adenine-specific)
MVELLNIDCMEYMATLPDKAFDLCLTDPPYGVNLNYSTYQDTEENWFNLMNRFIPEARRIAKMVIMPSCQIKRLKWFYENHPPDWLICWHKGSTGCVSFVGFNDWEPLVVYGKTNSKLYMHDYLSLTNGEALGKYGHPCPKPIMWSKLIYRNAIPNGGRVFDPFLGSGSSAIAAHYFGCDFVGCEIDVDYFNAAKERFDRETRQVAMW